MRRSWRAQIGILLLLFFDRLIFHLCRDRGSGACLRRAFGGFCARPWLHAFLRRGLRRCCFFGSGSFSPGWRRCARLFVCGCGAFGFFWLFGFFGLCVMHRRVCGSRPHGSEVVQHVFGLRGSVLLRWAVLSVLIFVICHIKILSADNLPSYIIAFFCDNCKSKARKNPNLGYISLYSCVILTFVYVSFAKSATFFIKNQIIA